MAIRPYLYLCGVSKDYCTGAMTPVNHGLENFFNKRAVLSHSSSEEAFHCMRRSLLQQGFTQVGTREFRPPDGGPIRILTKKIRFGGKMRNGKEGTRNMPHKRGGGIFFSC